jgi:hypothetical protein
MLDHFRKQSMSRLLYDYLSRYPSIFTELGQCPEANKASRVSEESEPEFDSGDEYKEIEWKETDKEKAAEKVHATCILTTLAPHEEQFINSFDSKQIVVNDIHELAREAEARRKQREASCQVLVPRNDTLGAAVNVE